MIAMAKPSSDSFLPSGAVEHFPRSMIPIGHFDGHPNSVISPLTLPQPLKQRSYFDSVAGRKLSPPNHAIASTQQKPPTPLRYLSPSQEHPPTSKTAGSAVASPSMAPSNAGSLSPFNYLSPDASTILLQRREDYIRRSQESWLAERTQLEASRARAEVMLQEERKWMDEERSMWVEEKIKSDSEIEHWKQRAEAADKEVARLTSMLQAAGVRVSNQVVGVNGTVESVATTHPLPDRQPGRHPLSGGESSSYGSPGTLGQSSVRYRSPSDGISPGTLPPVRGPTVPESNPFVPLDPRMQSSSPSGTTPPANERIPSIDIHEVIPGLEGVRLKAPAIQKPTFNEEIPLSPNFGSRRGSPPQSQKDTAEALPKASPLEMAKEALRAPEHHRLTMHAGHTPNHSVFISRAPTVESTAINTADSSGTSTPTQLEQELRLKTIDERGKLELPTTGQEGSSAHPLPDEPSFSEEAVLDTSEDDPALKGPLCLKNRPAADEIFLRRLSDKLEEVRATDATPSVLSDPAIPDDTDESSASMKPEAEGSGVANDGPDEDPVKDLEEEIPLKLKKSQNFGQPFGQARSGFSI
ncbi:hypothetical protein F5Y17DRAFT_221618 [Xylariaceae sp. FL0594]|nr:hypothetical protein F5Y17DRAFT_221618 [Xylariaceae sp. FL0594]